jgi:hypothetical protein
MKKVLLILVTIGVFTACSTKPANEDAQATSETEEATVEETATAITSITGFDSIEELATSLVESLKKDDYKEYFTHVMSEEMELAQAAKITDEAIRKEFLHEYGFSLHEEEAYFEELVNYYKKANIDLTKATVADMEYIEYKGGEYEPLKLYEVFIPIEMEVESLIDFTIIQVDGKYFLTSEIGI